MLKFRPVLQLTRSMISLSYELARRLRSSTAIGPDSSEDDAEYRKEFRRAQDNHSADRSNAGRAFAGVAGAHQGKQTKDRPGSGATHFSRCRSCSFSGRLPQKWHGPAQLFALHQRVWIAKEQKSGK